MALTAARLGTAVTPSPALVGGALSAGAIVLFAAADGGVAPSAWRAGLVAFVAAAGLLALWAPARPTRTAVAVLAPLGAYAALSLVSILWSADPSASLVDTQRTLLYIAGLASFVLAGEGQAAGVVAGAAGVGAWALAGRAIHGAPVDRYEGPLLTGPIGYANGLGALMAVGAAVCVALALREQRPLLAAPLAVLLPALALTNSRGSLAALTVGCAVAVALATGRRLAASLTISGSAVLLAALLIARPAGIGDRAHYWTEAVATAAAHPLGGTGAGTFGLVHVQAPYAHDTHSRYLQALSEVGFGGLALIVATVALPLCLAIHRNLAGPAAGLTVFALHAGIDWDWQLPAVTLASLSLAAATSRRANAGGRVAALAKARTPRRH